MPTLRFHLSHAISEKKMRQRRRKRKRKKMRKRKPRSGEREMGKMIR